MSKFRIDPRAFAAALVAVSVSQSYTQAHACGVRSLEWIVQPSATARSGVPLARQPVVVAVDWRGFVSFRPLARLGLSAYLDRSCTIPAPGTVTGSASCFLASSGIGAFTGVRYSGTSDFYLGVSADGARPACSRRIAVSPTQEQEEPAPTPTSSPTPTPAPTAVPVPVASALALDAPAVRIAGECSAAFTVSAVDDDGSQANVAADTPVLLSADNADPGELFADEACARPLGQLEIRAGAASASFHLRGTLAGRFELRASAAELAPSAPATHVVVAGSPSRLGFSSQPAASGRAGEVLPSGGALLLTDVFGNEAEGSGLEVAVEAFEDPACQVRARGALSFGAESWERGRAALTGIVYERGGTIHLGASVSASLSACSEAVTLVAADSLALGSAHTCALQSGGVSCWGLITATAAPVAIPGLESGVLELASGGSHACAVRAGGLECWGANGAGQLGDGTLSDSPLPVRAYAPGSGVRAVAAGESHTCVLREDWVECWGFNDNGQLGTGDYGYRPRPSRVHGLPGPVKSLVSSSFSTCALLEDGDAYCWGANGYGQLGNGETQDSPVPVRVLGLPRVLAIAPGSEHGCALLESGVACWGRGSSGQLGDGRFADSPLPVMVTGTEGGVSEISSGLNHSCLVDLSGQIRCWGNNSRGQLGDAKLSGQRSGVPVQVVGQLGRAKGLRIGYLHTCGFVGDGDGAQCWGWGRSGQLGQGELLESSVPVRVLGF